MKKWYFLLAGVIGVSLILGGSIGFAKSATEKISVRFSNIKLIVDGITINTKEEPFVYNGNVYAPVTTLASVLGIHQQWDNHYPAVKFSTNPIKPDEPLKYGVDKPMGRDKVYLLTDLNVRGHYTLDDNGKRIDIPHTGDTVITQVTPFLYLTAFGYPEDFLVIENDRNDKSIIYCNVYNYHQGKLTKVTSITYQSTTSSKADIHVAYDNGFYVYFNEHLDHKLVSTTAYEWDPETKTYNKIDVVSK